MRAYLKSMIENDINLNINHNSTIKRFKREFIENDINLNINHNLLAMILSVISIENDINLNINHNMAGAKSMMIDIENDINLNVNHNRSSRLNSLKRIENDINLNVNHNYAESYKFVNNIENDINLNINYRKMRLRINLTHPTQDVPVNNQHQMNGFIYAILGNDNPYHDSVSDYSISSLQGGKLKDDKLTLSFEESNPHFYVASQNSAFIGDFVLGTKRENISVFGMKIDNIDITYDFRPHDYCDDIITISPILIRGKDDRKIQFDSPEWSVEIMRNCTGKLRHQGIEDKTFRIELVATGKPKKKCVWVGDVFNPCSSVRLRVYGKKKTREALYNLGIGNSTGSGFGAVKIYGNK